MILLLIADSELRMIRVRFDSYRLSHSICGLFHVDMKFPGLLRRDSYTVVRTLKSEYLSRGIEAPTSWFLKACSTVLRTLNLSLTLRAIQMSLGYLSQLAYTYYGGLEPSQYSLISSLQLPNNFHIGFLVSILRSPRVAKEIGELMRICSIGYILSTMGSPIRIVNAIGSLGHLTSGVEVQGLIAPKGVLW